MPEKITIEELARMSQGEFTTINQRFDRVDGRLDKMDEKLDKVLHAVEGINLNISAYASRWTEDFAKLHDWVQEIDSRLKFLEKTGK